jgi:hypothetical protein
MGRKHVVTEFFAISAGDMSDASITSTQSDCQNVDHFQFLVSWTGTAPVGVLAVQQSTNGVDWTALDFGSSISVSGNTGSHTIIVEKISFKYCRLVYTKTSGLGTLVAKYSASTVGA